MTRAEADELVAALETFLDLREARRRYVIGTSGYTRISLLAMASRERLIDRVCQEEATQPGKAVSK